MVRRLDMNQHEHLAPLRWCYFNLWRLRRFHGHVLKQLSCCGINLHFRSSKPVNFESDLSTPSLYIHWRTNTIKLKPTILGDVCFKCHLFRTWKKVFIILCLCPVVKLAASQRSDNLFRRLLCVKLCISVLEDSTAIPKFPALERENGGSARERCQRLQHACPSHYCFCSSPFACNVLQGSAASLFRNSDARLLRGLLHHIPAFGEA